MSLCTYNIVCTCTCTYNMYVHVYITYTLYLYCTVSVCVCHHLVTCILRDKVCVFVVPVFHVLSLAPRVCMGFI